MNAQPTIRKTPEQERNILLALLYFDIFSYPLTAEEIGRFAPGPLSQEFNSSLANLINRRIVHQFEDFYSLNKDPAVVDRRKAGNVLAQKKIHTAKKFAKLIASFPFVRAVMLSGSISKGYMDEESDIDYFIITESGRLWFVRTAMALFRRVFLFNSHKYFCTNYFVGNKNLEISEKNIFTAVETTTLKPVYGKQPIYQFQKANSWCSTFLPNRSLENGLGDERESLLKVAGEKVLSLSLFDSLDRWLMDRSVEHWKKKYRQLLNQEDFLIAFQSTPHVSRSHPNFYQKKILFHYSEKISVFEREQGISLSA